MTNPLSSGDGSRPVTDGTVANVGAAKKFTGNGNEAPAHPERMSEKKQDAASAETSDSDAFNLHEDLKPAANTDPQRRGPDPGPSFGNGSKNSAPDAGDAPVGTTGNDGSSPYEEPNHRAKKQRDGA